MKKKFLLTLLSLVCALCCALPLSACGGGNDWVNGKVYTPPDHVYCSIPKAMQNHDEATGMTYLADRNEEVEIWVYTDADYLLGDVKMFINGEEAELTEEKYSGFGTQAKTYVCRYVPTKDFDITFTGSAVKQPEP